MFALHLNSCATHACRVDQCVQRTCLHAHDAMPVVFWSRLLLHSHSIEASVWLCSTSVVLTHTFWLQTCHFLLAVLAAAMAPKLQTNEATRAPEKQGSTAKTPADAQARVQLMDFTSRRSPVLGTRGMVASSQPLASEVSPCP